MTVKLEHAGVTVELKPEIKENYPFIYILINGRQVASVNEFGHMKITRLAEIVVR